MTERPGTCPACGGTALIRSGHACGRQRWRCKGCGRQFTRTTPRGKPAAMKREAVGLYCAGLSLNAIGQRLGVSAQSVMRWVRRSEEHTSELQSRQYLVCRLLLEKKKNKYSRSR